MRWILGSRRVTAPWCASVTTDVGRWNRNRSSRTGPISHARVHNIARRIGIRGIDSTSAAIRCEGSCGASRAAGTIGGAHRPTGRDGRPVDPHGGPIAG